MEKFMRVLIVMLFIFLIILISVHKDTNNIMEIGNSLGNYNNGCLVAFDKDWLYFESKYLGKLNKHTGKIVKLTDDQATNIQVLGDYVYYINFSDRGSLYRIKKDGSGKQLIVMGATMNRNKDGELDEDNFEGNFISEYVVTNKGIYIVLQPLKNSEFSMLKGERKLGIYYISLDNSNVKILNFNVSPYDTMQIYKNNIFCILMEKDTEYLAKLDLKGNVVYKFPFSSPDFVINNDWIYYINENDNSKIYRITIDGKNNTKLNDEFSENLNIKDDWLFYTGHILKNKWQGWFSFYKIKLDGSEKTILGESTYFKRGKVPIVFSLNIVDDWMYYEEDDLWYIFKRKIDGSGYSEFNVE